MCVYSPIYWKISTSTFSTGSQSQQLTVLRLGDPSDSYNYTHTDTDRHIWCIKWCTLIGLPILRGQETKKVYKTSGQSQIFLNALQKLQIFIRFLCIAYRNAMYELYDMLTFALLYKQMSIIIFRFSFPISFTFSAFLSLYVPVCFFSLFVTIF